MNSNGMISIGEPLPRVDGNAKVTGTAKYAAEFQAPGLVYGSLVMSTIPSGRITRIKTTDAARAPGVLQHKMPIEQDRLYFRQKRIVAVEVSPARLYHANL